MFVPTKVVWVGDRRITVYELRSPEGFVLAYDFKVGVELPNGHMTNEIGNSSQRWASEEEALSAAHRFVAEMSAKQS